MDYRALRIELYAQQEKNREREKNIAKEKNRKKDLRKITCPICRQENELTDMNTNIKGITNECCICMLNNSNVLCMKCKTINVCIECCDKL